MHATARTGHLIDAEPFADHLRYLVERDGASIKATAARLGMNDRTFRLIIHGQRTVDVSLVEQALIADDTTTLRELYPDLYAAEAA